MISYKKAGVDIERANKFIKDIKRLVSYTERDEVLKGIGGFGSLSRIPKKYKDPVLVTSTDGVGTKLLLAELLGRHTTVGIDLVAMCVNDIIVTGAEPLLFLDYFATGRLNRKKAREVIAGIVRGCREAGCALVGGETAEMPGMYKGEDYDLAGFCVGVVERDRIVDGRRVKRGNKIIGIQSSGVHSNGFSLIRKIFSRREIRVLENTLLKPTIIYTRPLLELLKEIRVNSIAHITGGGFYDNIPRVLPHGYGASINKRSWPIPEIFIKIQRKAKISDNEMFRIFNMGIGIILIVDKKDAKEVQGILRRFGLKSWVIGEIVKRKKLPAVSFTDSINGI